jgi:hypothetical protein
MLHDSLRTLHHMQQELRQTDMRRQQSLAGASKALLQITTGLIAIVLTLFAVGLGLGLGWGAFRAASSVVQRWLTL